MSSGTIAAVVPILPVRDLTRAIDFYERLEFAAKRYRDGDFYAFIQRDGRELHLFEETGACPGEQPRPRLLLFARGSCGRARSTMPCRGMTILEPLTAHEWKMKEFVLQEPDGNRLIFGEPLTDDQQ